MKKLLYILIGLALVFVFAKVSAKFQTTWDFNGNWSYTTESSQFDLSLIQNGSTLTGSHCSTMFSGNKIDCNMDSTELSINGTVTDQNMVTVEFKSHFLRLNGKATLKKISDTQIEWAIIEEPKGEYYIPDKVILTKK